jgi:hypothetical protein
MLFVSEMSLLAACFNSIAERHNDITFLSFQKRDGSPKSMKIVQLYQMCQMCVWKARQGQKEIFVYSNF